MNRFTKLVQRNTLGKARKMRWEVVFLLGAAFSFHQVVARVPSKRSMCGMIVDAKVEQECLSCFTKAGHISKHPEEVRNCTATYLPPDLAECSVPHSHKPDSVRIHQGAGNYHHNHTNANYLPSCLKRRLKKLISYQMKENLFVSQASPGVKYIVESRLVENGGPTMLSILAMASLVDHLSNMNVVKESVSECQGKFSRSRLQYWERDLWEETDDFLLEDFMKEEEEMEEDDDMADEMEEDNELMKISMRTPGGNKLPYGGTNSLARMVMLQECIATSLIERGAGPDILQFVMRENFYDPVPSWLVKPLLLIAKNAAGPNT